MTKISVSQTLDRAKSYLKKGNFMEAEEHYAQVLMLFPNNATANQGLINLKKIAPVSVNETPPQKLIHKLVSLVDKEKLSLTVTQTENLLVYYPRSVILWYILGNVSAQLMRYEESINAYGEVIKLMPQHAEAYSAKAVVLKNQGLLDDAIDCYKQAISIKPDYAEAYNNMGIALKEQGKIDEAINSYKEAIKLRSNYANAYNSLGIAFRQKGKLCEAVHAYRTAISFDNTHADAHKNLSYALFDTEQISEALEQYEWRWQTSEFANQKREFRQPAWDGKQDARNKTLLCWSEQGIGDTIAWSWSLLYLAPQVKECVLECPEKLVSLLDRSFPNVTVRPENREQDLSRDDFDVHLPMGSTFRVVHQSMPISSKLDAFLKPDQQRVAHWKGRLRQLGKGPFIGVSWTSATINNGRQENYTKVEDWKPIFKQTDAIFINLQYKEFETSLSQIRAIYGIKVHNFAELDHFNDLCDVAALCSALDIVVSIKNTVSLIAAGVGTQTILLNWKQSDWNNVLHNPAGPKVKIFERNSSESWEKVMQLAANQIQKLVC